MFGHFNPSKIIVPNWEDSQVLHHVRRAYFIPKVMPKDDKKLYTHYVLKQSLTYSITSYTRQSIYLLYVRISKGSVCKLNRPSLLTYL